MTLMQRALEILCPNGGDIVQFDSVTSETWLILFGIAPSADATDTGTEQNCKTGREIRKYLGSSQFSFIDVWTISPRGTLSNFNSKKAKKMTFEKVWQPCVDSAVQRLRSAIETAPNAVVYVAGSANKIIWDNLVKQRNLVIETSMLNDGVDVGVAKFNTGRSFRFVIGQHPSRHLQSQGSLITTT